MDLRASYQKLVTKVTDLENEKADLQSELEQIKLLTKYKKSDYAKERDEFQAEISELQMLVEDLRTQVENKLCLCRQGERIVSTHHLLPNKATLRTKSDH